jgi:integrase
LDKYNREKDALHAGRKPRPDANAVTVKEVANEFLNAKRALVEAGELSERTWNDYHQVAVMLVSHLGKTRLVDDLAPDDFASLRNRIAKRWGVHRVTKLIQYSRSLFKHAFEAGLIDRPVRFGPGFKRPSKKTVRQNRAKRGKQLFTPDEIKRLLDATGVPLKAMILLGINAGFGNADCAHLPLSALDLDGGWIDFPRPKTGVERRCPLWPETVAAIRETLANRPEPKDKANAGLIFITKYGLSWSKSTSDNPLSKETRKLLDSLDINGRRNFYVLRHTFRTVSDETRDQPAIDRIMGHETAHIAEVYRERIGDDRLLAVSNHVRFWLFGAPKAEPARANE